MTNEEVYEALKSGKTRFIAKRSKRIYLLHVDQMEILKPFTDDILLIGFPETLPAKMSMRRYRGRKWVWLSPKGIELASKQGGGGQREIDATKAMSDTNQASLSPAGNGNGGHTVAV